MCIHMFCLCPLLCDWALHILEYLIKYQVCFNTVMWFLPDQGDHVGKIVNTFLSALVTPSSYLIIILEYRECLNDRP